MARIGRLVVPGPPHHVTQRGNRRLNVFFSNPVSLSVICRNQGFCKASPELRNSDRMIVRFV